MSAIKPGCLCLLRNLKGPLAHWNGWVVTAVRFKPAAASVDLRVMAVVIDDVWEIAAPWMPPEATWQFHARHLLPICDPDADLSMEDELEELVLEEL